MPAMCSEMGWAATKMDQLWERHQRKQRPNHQFVSVLGSRVDAVVAMETYDAVSSLRGLSRVGAGRGGRAADKEKTRAL